MKRERAKAYPEERTTSPWRPSLWFPTSASPCPRLRRETGPGHYFRGLAVEVSVRPGRCSWRLWRHCRHATSRTAGRSPSLRSSKVQSSAPNKAGGGGADARPFPNVATAAVAAMDRALSEAALTSRDIDKARHTRAPACGQALCCPWCSLFASVEVEVHSRAALEKSESLDEKASELSKLPSCDSCGGGRAPQAAAAGCLPSSGRVSSMSGSAGLASFVGRCFLFSTEP